MDTTTTREPTEPLSVLLDDVKQAGSRLVEAYIAAGTNEVLGTSRRVILAKYSLVALSALAIGLSLYGIFFELAYLTFTNYWLDGTPELRRLAAHGLLVILFTAVALVLSVMPTYKPK